MAWRRATSTPIAAIRWAEPDDCHRVARLWHRVWHLTYGRHITRDALALCTLESFERRVGSSLFERDPTAPGHARPRHTCLVAEHEDPRRAGDADAALAGFAILRGGAELAHLYVENESHGNGWLAAQLLDAAETELYEHRGCECAHLSVSVRNLRAQRFYEKHGWIGTPKRAWMRTAPWVAWRPDALRIEDEELRARVLDGGLTAEEHAATSMRGQCMKKFLEFPPEEDVPRSRSSLPAHMRPAH